MWAKVAIFAVTREPQVSLTSRKFCLYILKTFISVCAYIYFNMPPKKQPEVDATAKQDFEEKLKNKGFSEKTIQTLAENEFTDDKGLQLLGSNPDEIEELGLSLQQKLLLKEYVATGHGAAGAAIGSTSQPLHNVMGGLLAGAQLPGPVGSQKPTQQPLPGSMDPQVYLQGGCMQPKKYLDIIDYINMIPPMADEQLMCEDGGISMVVRSGAKRPPLESVTVEEWCLANTRIMNELMTDNDPFCLSDYLAYTVKICQLFKQFDRTSVLQFDREYRYLQSVYKFRWGTDTPHLHTTCLRQKSLGHFSAQRSSSTQNRATKPRQSSEVCRLYNTIKGCHFAANCKYIHRCNYTGCTESHSRAHAHSVGQDANNEQLKD